MVLMMYGSDDGAPVLRIWRYTDAPADLRRQVPNLGTHAWIAHIPAEVMQEPLLSVLQLNSDPSQPIQTLTLADGDFLCVGLMPSPAKKAQAAAVTFAKTSKRPE
jgi:hypothetical protein